MKVAGFDLSLTSSGVSTEVYQFTISPPGKDLTDRLFWLRDEFDDALDGIDLAIVEDLPRNARFGGVALGMVHACFRLATTHHRTLLVWVPPASLKLYATGKGNAGKQEMLTEAVRRLGYSGHDDNEADALWLRAIGMDIIGEPLAGMPAKNRTALDKLTIPAGLTRSL